MTAAPANPQEGVAASASGHAQGGVAAPPAGEEITPAFRATGKMPEMTLQMMATGEESGQMDAMLIKTSEFYDRQVEAAVAGLPDEWSDIEILVNNAGLSRGLAPLQRGLHTDWEEMLDTNVKGLLWVDRAVTPGMVERGRGTVIHIGSIAGRWVYPKGAVYNATKFAVRALSEAMNIDLLGTKIRVSSVDPGLAETEFSEVRFDGDTNRAASVYSDTVPLTANDVADAVIYVANAPPHVDIFNLVMMPTVQRYPGYIERTGG